MVSRSAKLAALAMLHDLRSASVVQGHDGSLHRHRLREHKSKGFLEARKREDDLQSPERLAAMPSQRLIRPIFLRRGKGFTIYGPAPDALRSYRIRSHS
jgi:hypothetical protein